MTQGSIEGSPKTNAAKVYLGEDKILRVEIDLNVAEGMEVEGRVGAYGTLKWAEEIVSRFFTIREMQLAKKQAENAKKSEQFGVIMPKPGWNVPAGPTGG